MNHLDLKYACILSTRLDRYVVKSHQPYRANFRCDVCGDSQKSKSKTRGWILDKEDTGFYYCHNCGVSRTLEKYLKEYHTALYNEYITDKILEKKNVTSFLENTSNAEEELSNPPKVDYTKPLSRIKKISSLKAEHPAKKYIVNRKIPSKEHYRLYYAPKFNKWVNSIIPQKLNETYDEPRLVTPFLNDKGKMFGFAGRSFNPKSELRYITIMLDNRMSKIFGLDVVDFNKRYFVVEGQIDSLFLSNAVAMAGADGNSHGLKNTENAVFVFDNEPRNPEIVARMEKVIAKGYKVVVWSDKLYALGKDINDLILSGIKTADIDLILDQYTYKGLEAKLALSIWKRV